MVVPFFVNDYIWFDFEEEKEEKLKDFTDTHVSERREVHCTERGAKLPPVRQPLFKRHRFSSEAILFSTDRKTVDMRSYSGFNWTCCCCCCWTDA